MRRIAAVILAVWLAPMVAAMVALPGCAVRSARPTSSFANAKTKPIPTTRPGKADLTLAQVAPDVALPTSRPADDNAPAPLDAIELFAQARDAMLRGQRYTAINLLEKAVKLDPKSYEVRYLLGQAYTGGGVANDQSIAAYEAAAAIDPDHVVVHSELGRQYLAKGDTKRAVDHLMLALQTSDYEEDDNAAAVVDFYLGKSLQQAGYELAALECFEKLIDRLQAGGLSVRSSPELAFLVAQPETLYLQVGELLEKRGRTADAIKLYEAASERKPDDFPMQAHLIRAMARSGRQDEAKRGATDAVRQFRASPDSIALLKEVFQTTGGDDAVVRELDRLRLENPADRTILYAEVDVLGAQGKPHDATKLLADAARGARYETDLTRRLFKLYESAGEVDSAAKLLIEALAARPDNTRDIAPMWQQLLRPWLQNHLTVAKVRALEVPPAAQASKLFWVSELARVWNREALSRSSLEQAVKQVPPFAPAYRVLLGSYWQRDDWDDRRKREASQALVSSLERQGEVALATELRGLAYLNDKDPARACAAFAKAQELGDDAPDLRLAYASALQAKGDTALADQVLWKLTNDQPTCEEAYMQLFRTYIERGQADTAVKVLQTWLANDPQSSNAHILEATVLLQAKQPDAAERALNDLFDREPDDANVLTSMAGFYNQTGRTAEYVSKLEAQRTAHPENRAAVEQLVLIYAGQKRIAEATRVLDAARSSAKNDTDLLYYIANLYTRIGEKETTEQMLEQIIQIDPKNAPACNDLGYGWAEQGKNLNRAESLVRIAVDAEPDNHSFLDSLGWVLYKRGQFEEARQKLQTAVEAASYPDPVVLDHLGDTLYRLQNRADATKQWKRSQEGIAKSSGDDRDDVVQLRLLLKQKIKQAESGQPVMVSPVADEAPKQAKS